MKENKEEMGRIVPNYVTASNTSGSFRVAKELNKKGVEVYFIDNSLGKNNSKIVA
jgi:hypothetical protein